MANNTDKNRLQDLLSWHEYNAEALRELIAKYDKAERELLEREMLGLWHNHAGEVS